MDDRPGDERFSTNDQHRFPVMNLHNFRIYYFCHNVDNNFFVVAQRCGKEAKSRIATPCEG